MYWEGPGPSAATLHANSKKNTNTAGEDVATATHNTANPTDAPSSVTRVPFLKERWPAAQSWQAWRNTLKTNEHRAASLIGEGNRCQTPQRAGTSSNQSNLICSTDSVDGAERPTRLSTVSCHVCQRGTSYINQLAIIPTHAPPQALLTCRRK